MLVLVLILVVIALVLLLAGWFLHLVVLAWTSVGISVLAGLVLLYDWWQTRSAVRAGRQGSSGSRDGNGDRAVPQGAAAGAVGAGAVGAGAAGGAAPAAPDGYGGADMEPATQVLPVVPPPTNAADETVVMPVVAPSGSTEAPSGASRSSGLSSQSVTKPAADEPATTRSTDGGTTAADLAGPEPGGGGDPAAGFAPPAESRADRAREAGPDAAGAARTPDASESPTTAGSAGSAGSAGEPPAGATQAVAASGEAGASAVGGAAVAGGAVAGGAAAVAAGSASGRADDGTTHADRPAGAGSGAGSGAGDGPTSAVAAGGGAPPADDRTRAAEGIDTSGEAPEEPRDPAHASLVARLPDEVIVIDEHPRYHVQGCPSLPGQPLIPLPVSEAVELGFTPCGWCTPNRVLSERNPAEAR